MSSLADIVLLFQKKTKERWEIEHRGQKKRNGENIIGTKKDNG